MSSNTSRFTSSNQTTHERLSTHTVGLVALSDFRKRRAEVLEQQEREAREAALGNTSSRTGTPANDSDASSSATGPAKKKKKKKGGMKLSFGDDEDTEGDAGVLVKKTGRRVNSTATSSVEDGEESKEEGEEVVMPKKMAVNASVPIVPKAVTKAALRKQAAEREALRKEFLKLQTKIKATEIAIPFVFYDGSDIPGGTVRVKKGDFVWLFLDKSRKVGAELGVGGDKKARREWARVGVDDLMLVRGNLIIPHHYEFYFFIMNKKIGPGGRRLFDYSAEASAEADAEQNRKDEEEEEIPQPAPESYDPLAPPAPKPVTDIRDLEGADDDPSFTKVVDRRWYERNKHIFPASTWQDFDPEKDYTTDIRRDAGGNAFFYSK